MYVYVPVLTYYVIMYTILFSSDSESILRRYRTRPTTVAGRGIAAAGADRSGSSRRPAAAVAAAAAFGLCGLAAWDQHIINSSCLP
jgi:hypothetical protein